MANARDPMDEDYIDAEIEEDELNEPDSVESKIYNELNLEQDPFTSSASATRAILPSKETMIIKNTVHQKIFIDSGILTDLGRDFNSQIIFRREDGRYALFIRPNGTNYMINVTNGLGGNPIFERIFFNLSLKSESDIKQKIKTEYMSQYIFKDGVIFHEYQMEGEPPTVDKNSVSLSDSDRENIYNAYIKLNNLINKYVTKQVIIKMGTELSEIQLAIRKILSSKMLEKSDRDEITRINKIFKDANTKAEHDNFLNKNYLLNKRFLKISLGDKTPEQIDSKPKNRLLYKTNNKFTNMLAYRYANFIPKSEFEFTKSSKVVQFQKVLKNKGSSKPEKMNYSKKYEFTDPLKYKLETPFTATDIYLHKFDRHFDNMYGLDRYDIKTPDQFMRLAKLVELAKSIMFNFISISHNILLKQNQFYNTNITINIHDIYQNISWNNPPTNNIIWKKNFLINKKNRGDTLIALEIKQLGDGSFDILNNIPVAEIPYIGVYPAIAEPKEIKGIVEEISRVPIIDIHTSMRQLSSEIRGIERAMIGKEVFNADKMDRIYRDFFDKVRETVVAVEVKQEDLVELTPEEFIKFYPLTGENVTQQMKDDRAKHNVMKIEREAKAPKIVALPFSSQINKIVIDIVQLRKDIDKPVEGESRRDRDNRRKRLEPLFKELKEKKEKQIEEMKKQNMVITQEVLKMPAAVSYASSEKPSRRKLQDMEIQKSINENRPLVMAERKSAEEYALNAKSPTQKQIGDIKLRIVEIKDTLLLHPPRGSDKEIQRMKDEYKPLNQEYETLDKILEELMQKDDIEQGRIEETRRRLIAKEEAKRDAILRKEQEDRKKSEEKQERELIRAMEENDRLKQEQELISKMTPEERRTYVADKKAKEADEIRTILLAKAEKEAKEKEKANMKALEAERLAKLKEEEEARKLQISEEQYRLNKLRRLEEEKAEEERKQAKIKADMEELERIKIARRKEAEKQRLFTMDQKKTVEISKINAEYKKKIDTFIKDKDALLRRKEEINLILANPGRRTKKEITSLGTEQIEIDTKKIVSINSEIRKLELVRDSKIQEISGVSKELSGVNDEVDFSMIQKYLKYKEKYLQLKLNHIK